MSRRYLQFKKNSKFIYPIIDCSGKETGLQFPMDSPISFTIENEYFTPIADLLKFAKDVVSDGLLNFVKAVMEGVDLGAKMLGVAAHPRSFFANAWRDSKPIQFTIVLNLNFGWRGMYDNREEVQKVAEALIDASLPYLDKWPKDIGKDIIFAPAPSGTDVFLSAADQLMKEVKNTLGPLGFFIRGDDKKKLEKSEKLLDKYDFAVCQYDVRTEDWVVQCVRTRKGNIFGGDIQTDEIQEKAYAPYKKQVDRIKADLKRDFDLGIVPTCFLVETLKGSGEGAAYIDEATDLNEVFYRTTILRDDQMETGWYNGFVKNAIYVPLSEIHDDNEEIGVATKDDTSDTWEVIINDRISITNLVLHTLTYVWGNEQDENGNPISVQMTLTFISQNFPVSLYDRSSLYDFKIT